MCTRMVDAARQKQDQEAAVSTACVLCVCMHVCGYLGMCTCVVNAARQKQDQEAVVCIVCV
jgi:hypothetical protein